MKIEANKAASYLVHLETLASIHLVSYDHDHAGYAKLVKLEAKASRNALRYCNGEMFEAAYKQTKDSIIKSLTKIIKDNAAETGDDHAQLPPGFFINGDPRGYALKIEDNHRPAGMYSDWGGYGIICPDFSA